MEGRGEVIEVRQSSLLDRLKHVKMDARSGLVGGANRPAQPMIGGPGAMGASSSSSSSSASLFDAPPVAPLFGSASANPGGAIVSRRNFHGTTIYGGDPYVSIGKGKGKAASPKFPPTPRFSRSRSRSRSKGKRSRSSSK